MTVSKRGYTAGKYALELGKVSAGWLFSAEGGHPVGEVVVEKLSQEHHTRKHIGGLKYEDITICCGMGMSKGFYKWMINSFTDKVLREEGAIHVCDFDGNIRHTLNFYNALITEIGFPALDASSKDAAKFTLKLSPEWTKTVAGDGKVNVPEYSLGTGQQKKWATNAFRLRIDGLDEACQRANKVEALVIKQKVVENAVGEMRTMTKEPASLEIPNLVFSTAESHSGQLYDWEHDFLIKGNSTDDDEKTGTLEFLTHDLKETMFTVQMEHIGIFKLTPDKMDSHAESIRRVKAEMYVEMIKFEYGNGSTWA